MGYDPAGTFNLSGFIVGLAMVIVSVVVTATSGLGLSSTSPLLVTGANMMIAAANDSAMVIDSSYSFSIGGPLLRKNRSIVCN